MPFPPTYYVLVPLVALDPTCLGFTQSASRLAVELPPLRTCPTKALRRFRQLVGYDLAPIFALSFGWEEKLLVSSMAHSIAEAFNTVRCLDHSGKLDDFPQDKKQEAATALHRDKLHG